MEKKEMHSYSNSFYHRSQLTLENVAVETDTLKNSEQPHAHDNIEYCLILGGTGYLDVNGERYTISTNDYIRFFPFHVHRLVPEEPLRFLRISFPLELLVYLDMSKRFANDSLYILECGSPVVALSDKDSPSMQQLFLEIKQELKKKNDFYEFFVLSNVMKMVNIYERMALSQNRSRDAQHNLLWQVLQYMHVHFNSSAGEVAKAFSISVPYLNYLFRCITGSNFTENRHQVRIRNACSMMQFEELSIAFIANYVGYHSLSTFYRVFHKLKGMTPEEYRKKSPSNAVYRSDTAWQILLYLFEHYNENLDIVSVSDYFFMSRATLTEILKRNYGTGFSRLLTSIRLVYARALLAGTEMPVYDIAMIVGFRSIRTFRRNFEQDTGMTPSSYRGSECT